MAIKYFQDSHITNYQGDCRNMAELPDDSVQCVATSPPYWGLRKYSGEQELIWHGEKDCEHQWENKIIASRYKANETNPGKEGYTKNANQWRQSRGNFCSLCGVWKGAFGLEPTPEMYVQHTIEILREIRRVLRKDGVIFWNIGDSYYTSMGGYYPNLGEPGAAKLRFRDKKPSHNILKPKDLCLIPFRLAIALQEDGWWIRSVIIWSKLNPMPESVTDRPTESHEYILMLTKSKNYYYDQEAAREAYTEPLNRWGGPEFRNSSHKYIELGGHDGEQHYGATSMFRKGRPVRPIESGRNLRSVWEFPTQPYPRAHFAVFPEKLPEICIKAATPEVGCCSKCGAPWARISDDKSIPTRIKQGNYKTRDPERHITKQETLGWRPTCQCNADKVPSLVLDPFAGSGTTLWVAKKLGRRAVGYEISEEYCQLALERNRQGVLE